MWVTNLVVFKTTTITWFTETTTVTVAWLAEINTEIYKRKSKFKSRK